jgi:hypothetical protein
MTKTELLALLDARDAAKAAKAAKKKRLFAWLDERDAAKAAASGPVKAAATPVDEAANRDALMAKAAEYERRADTVTDTELRGAFLAKAAETRALAPVIPRKDAEDLRKAGADTQRRQAVLNAAEYQRKAAGVLCGLNAERRNWLLGKARECLAEAASA